MQLINLEDLGVWDLTIQLIKHCIYVSKSLGTVLHKSKLVAVVIFYQMDILQAEC
jgi:hypothetical protein